MNGFFKLLTIFITMFVLVGTIDAKVHPLLDDKMEFFELSLKTLLHDKLDQSCQQVGVEMLAPKVLPSDLEELEEEERISLLERQNLESELVYNAWGHLPVGGLSQGR